VKGLLFWKRVGIVDWRSGYAVGGATEFTRVTREQSARFFAGARLA